MLFSPSHNFTFIHISKNGGSTVRRALAPYAWPQKTRTAKSDIIDTVAVWRKPEQRVFPPHASAQWVRRKLGRSQYDRSFSFAIVRNPYDRAVSRYEYIRQTPHHHNHQAFQTLSFKQFLVWERRRNRFFRHSQLAQITDEQRHLLVSKVYRFENMGEAVTDICATVGVSVPVEIKKYNASTRASYQWYYGPEEKAIADRLYRDDLDGFEYEF